MKRRQGGVPEDSVVAEVRKSRARMVAQAGGTVDGLMKFLDQQAVHRRAAAKPAAPTRGGRRSSSKGRKAA
jgi:hypothetical protein